MPYFKYQCSCNFRPFFAFGLSRCLYLTYFVVLTIIVVYPLTQTKKILNSARFYPTKELSSSTSSFRSSLI